MMYPVKNYKITCEYGKKGSWSCGRHCGIDLVPAKGDYNIYAPCRAYVQSVIRGHASYGNCIVLKHSDGYCSRYAHLDSISAAQGQFVSEGDVIGVMGNTGNSSGRHLHFEVHKGTQISYPANTNPVEYLKGAKTVTELTKINDIAYDLGQRGIVSDTANLIKEVEKEPNGTLYWVCRKALRYIREHE